MFVDGSSGSYVAVGFSDLAPHDLMSELLAFLQPSANVTKAQRETRKKKAGKMSNVALLTGDWTALQRRCGTDWRQPRATAVSATMSQQHVYRSVVADS